MAAAGWAWPRERPRAARRGGWLIGAVTGWRRGRCAGGRRFGGRGDRWSQRRWGHRQADRRRQHAGLVDRRLIGDALVRDAHRWRAERRARVDHWAGIEAPWVAPRATSRASLGRRLGGSFVVVRRPTAVVPPPTRGMLPKRCTTTGLTSRSWVNGAPVNADWNSIRSRGPSLANARPFSGRGISAAD